MSQIRVIPYDLPRPSDYFTSADSLLLENIVNERYHQRVDASRERWMKLIPNKTSIQYAGDIGMLSTGVGWDYGKNNSWETYMLVGFLPKNDTRKGYLTYTLKEFYTPWRAQIRNTPVVLEPLFCSFMVNSILSEEFWVKEPERYPHGYYIFSSRLRFHVGVGQKVTIRVPDKYIRGFKCVSLYYEVSTCELYLRQKLNSSTLPFKDILCLGIGAQYTFF